MTPRDSSLPIRSRTVARLTPSSSERMRSLGNFSPTFVPEMWESTAAVTSSEKNTLGSGSKSVMRPIPYCAVEVPQLQSTWHHPSLHFCSDLQMKKCTAHIVWPHSKSHE